MHSEDKCSFFMLVMLFFLLLSVPHCKAAEDSFLDVLGIQAMLMAEFHSLLCLRTYFIYVQFTYFKQMFSQVPTRYKLSS